ncbi:unnamed protein product [Caenorhabditis angaria]|uniref:F-box domain-containing protein n=1 Tax=Caenorhabditis angaria TaxID=860376 RepID=A0A9P1IHV3_9PELO|nr:unnamed protein product [Caenorhabditis angaria]
MFRKLFLKFSKCLRFFITPFARHIEEEEKEEKEEEAPIKKLPAEVLGVIFTKLKYEDAQNFKNLSSSLLNAYKFERRNLPGPECNAHVRYKNKELRLEITIMKTIQLAKIIPLQITVPLTKTVPLNEWKYLFKNSKCKEFSMTVDEDIPIDVLKTIFCCRSIKFFIYCGKSINQMTIDLVSAYKPKKLNFFVNNWHSEIQDHPDEPGSYLASIRKFFEQNEHFLIRRKHNANYIPFFFIMFHTNPNAQKVQSIKLFLEKNVSGVYDCDVECKQLMGTKRVLMILYDAR